MTTQLINNLTAEEPKKTATEIATEALTNNNSPQLVSSLTVDQLKELITDVVDARLNSFLVSLNVEPDSLSRLLKLVSVTPSEAMSDQQIIEENVQKENPWLKMAGLHKDNPLFEGVVAYIEANRQNDFVEEIS